MSTTRNVGLVILLAQTFILLGPQAGYAADCNSNGIEDALDIAGATSPDCNSNGVPDICDFWDGSSAPVLAFPAPLNTNVVEDSSDDRFSQLTTDGLGNWIAVWVSNNDLSGAIGTDSDILVTRSTDDGDTWSDPTPLNNNADSDSGDDSFPQLTTGGSGVWIAVWRSDDDQGGTIGTDTDILFARSVNDGATWTAPLPLNSNASSDSGTDGPPQLTTDGSGNWVAVWKSRDDLGGTIGTDADVLIARSSDNGVTWTDPKPLNGNAGTDSGNDLEPRVATDGSGKWIAVWHSNEDVGGAIRTDYDILLARSSDNGVTWTYPAVLNGSAVADTNTDQSGRVATDGAGNWVAVWFTWDNLGGTIGTDPDILVARSTDDGASWTYPASLNTNADIDSGHDWFPELTTDGLGNWFAVWESWDDFGGTIGTDADIVMAWSTDNGASWAYPVPLNTSAAVDSAYDSPGKLTTDGWGNWIVLWTSNNDLGGTIGADMDILMTRFLLGASVDCNLNNVPDECDIAGGTSADCNGNGVIDACDVGSGNPDGVGVVDVGDYVVLAECFTGPCVLGDCDPPLYGDRCCALGDLDVDGDVDLRDYAILQSWVVVVERDCNVNGIPDRLETPTGDFDGDGVTDADDYSEFAYCLTGMCTAASCEPPVYGDPCCALADTDADGDVDLIDFAAVQRWFAAGN